MRFYGFCKYFLWKQIWWRNQIETFSTLLGLCDGNPPVTCGHYSHKSQWRGALIFSLICAWTNVWAKSRDANDLRRHRENHYVPVMEMAAMETSRNGALVSPSRGHWETHTFVALQWRHNGLTIVYSTVYSDADQRKHQSSASLAFVREIHPGPVNSPHKWPVTRKMFSFDDVIMDSRSLARSGQWHFEWGLVSDLDWIPLFKKGFSKHWYLQK